MTGPAKTATTTAIQGQVEPVSAASSKVAFGVDSGAQCVDHALRISLGLIVLAVMRGLHVGANADRESAANG